LVPNFSRRLPRMDNEARVRCVPSGRGLRGTGETRPSSATWSAEANFAPLLVQTLMHWTRAHNKHLRSATVHLATGEGSARALALQFICAPFPNRTSMNSSASTDLAGVVYPNAKVASRPLCPCHPLGPCSLRQSSCRTGPSLRAGCTRRAGSSPCRNRLTVTWSRSAARPKGSPLQRRVRDVDLDEPVSATLGGPAAKPSLPALKVMTLPCALSNPRLGPT
jgi:hypothetical protein